MAFADVNPSSALWLKRGLANLLLPFDAPLPLSLLRGKSQKHKSAATLTTVPLPAPLPASHIPVTASVVEDAWKPLPEESWPAPWRKRFAVARPGLIVWTYWDLGADMCVEANDKRRDFFKKLLAHLGHPAGTHTFWPACLPGDSAEGASDTNFTPNAGVFWSGAHSLGARGVVVMGSAAAKAVALPGNPRPMGQMRYRGQSVCVLRDVEYLMREEARYAPVLAFLRTALRSMANARTR